jgi:hypothetical protein
MNKIALFAIVLLALAMTASAQTMIRFTDLPPTAIPTAIPENYYGLNWTGIDYVSPLLWGYTNGNIETGDGFTTGPEAMVGFGGGPLCYQKHGGQTNKNICSATIAAGVSPTALAQFQPVYAWVSEGWSSDGTQSVVAQAYNNGNLVGSQKFNLKAKAEKFQLVFPNWGPITELKFIPNPGGSFVLYVLEMQ